MAKHGVFVERRDTAISTPVQAETGIPFVVGTAPLSQAGHAATANVPVLCTSFEEAEDKLGYSDDWEKNTLCEFMYHHFKIAQCQPVLFLPVGETAETAAIAAGVENVELCLTKYGIIPDMLLAPGFSHEKTVAAALCAKATAINGIFKAKAILDINADTYTAAIEAKSASLPGNPILCFPKGKIGDKTFHLSTVVAGCISTTDSSNSGIPYESPSNKSVSLDSLVASNGKEILLTKAQADQLNQNGIVTAINFLSKFVVWGNYTAAYPTSTDVKDIFIPISRMFDWINNTLIKTFWSYLDRPNNRRLIDSILDTTTIWINGLVGSGYLLGGRVELKDEENPSTDLMAGIIRPHIYITLPSPGQEIDFIVEYDPQYVEQALS